MIDWRHHLTSDPAVCHGQLCAKGTRIFVTTILDSVAAGISRDDLLNSYPTLRPEHIDAAPAYAAELAREESLLPIVRQHLPALLVAPLEGHLFIVSEAGIRTR